MTEERLVDRIKRHEGFQQFPYRDTKGLLTIGYGRNLEAVGIREPEADEMLLNDIAKATGDLLDHFPWVDYFPGDVINVMIEMVFNLGIAGFSEFKNMLEFLEASNFNDAADEMLDSKWHEQVGKRAEELANIVRKFG